MDATSSTLLPIGPMAREIGVTVAWLRDEADAGRVPHLRAGKRYLFSPQAVLDSLAARASCCGSRSACLLPGQLEVTPPAFAEGGGS